jgi:septum formation topological specificity factor MinE
VISFSGLLLARLRDDKWLVEARRDMANEPEDCEELREELLSLRSRHAPSETERSVLE